MKCDVCKKSYENLQSFGCKLHKLCETCNLVFSDGKADAASCPSCTTQKVLKDRTKKQPRKPAAFPVPRQGGIGNYTEFDYDLEGANDDIEALVGNVQQTNRSNVRDFSDSSFDTSSSDEQLPTHKRKVVPSTGKTVKYFPYQPRGVVGQDKVQDRWGKQRNIRFNVENNHLSDMQKWQYSGQMHAGRSRNQAGKQQDAPDEWDIDAVIAPRTESNEEEVVANKWTKSKNEVANQSAKPVADIESHPQQTDRVDPSTQTDWLGSTSYQTDYLGLCERESSSGHIDIPQRYHKDPALNKVRETGVSLRNKTEMNIGSPPQVVSQSDVFEVERGMSPNKLSRNVQSAQLGCKSAPKKASPLCSRSGSGNSSIEGPGFRDSNSGNSSDNFEVHSDVDDTDFWL